MTKADIFELSPYDVSFPQRLLHQAIDSRLAESYIVTRRVYNDVMKQTNYMTAVSPGEEKLRLSVDTTDEFIQDYKDGVVKLARENGHLVAQLKNNGKYGSKLAIKEEVFIDGPSELDVKNALQLQAIQKELAVISEQIRAIDESVKEVLTGQQNDRLGLFYSGVALYIEANNVSDDFFKKQLVAQALKALSDSVFQLTLTIQSDIKYLAYHEYDTNKKNKFNLINEKIESINQSFMAIHQASIMKAGIYCQQNEMKAMVSVLHEYEKFISGTIVANAEMLSQCDSRDNGKNSGIWKKRAGLELGISNIVKQLQDSQHVLYIEYDKEEE